ncbi:MAG: hypothetical protein ACPL6C_01420 [bacterium]
MRKFVAMMLVATLILGIALPVVAQEKAPEKPKRGGLTACLIGCCFGSRVGYMYNEGVGIRTWEILERLTSIAVIISLIEIYNGKTWTEIEKKEGLRDPAFVEWHKWQVIH